jgi:hypothetical protein
MKRIVRLLVGCAAVLTLVSPAFARVAAIATTVPLTDDSEPAMHAAVEEALSTLARGAQARASLSSTSSGRLSSTTRS